MPKTRTEPIDPVSALGFKPDFDTIILQGDCSNWLKEMPAESVNCAVSSPPYFGLRDYGTATWEGGSSECDHVETVQNLNSGFNERWGNSPGDRKQENCRVSQYRGTCAKCGAVRRDLQVGLESTLDEYLDKLVTVFRDVWQVLRDDGTLWLNLGDSFASSWPCQRRNVVGSGSLSNGKREARPPRLPNGLKEKDLMGVPWRVAFALQSDGWYLRSDIVWAKGNPMPESVTDRPTRSHEYLFLFTKSPRYWYDADAVREPSVSKPQRRLTAHSAHPKGESAYGAHRRPAYPESQKTEPGVLVHPLGRNRRTVWNINAKPFKGAHFATFPPALVEPCILAGCPEGGVVLDPFAGSGTVGLTARSLNRRSVLIELNPEYVEMIENRLEDRFTTVSPKRSTAKN